MYCFFQLNASAAHTHTHKPKTQQFILQKNFPSILMKHLCHYFEFCLYRDASIAPSHHHHFYVWLSPRSWSAAILTTAPTPSPDSMRFSALCCWCKPRIFRILCMADYYLITLPGKHLRILRPLLVLLLKNFHSRAIPLPLPLVCTCMTASIVCCIHVSRLVSFLF